MTPDANFNSMHEIREFMYKLVDEIHSEYRDTRKINTYYEKYTNYN